MTGIGETKHGLPLGRLYVKLLEIQQFNEKEKPAKIKIRINVQANRRGGQAAGPPITALSYSRESFFTEDGVAKFDQSIGPFAPIRTMDADVEFDVVDVSENANNAIVAMASIRLRDLQDQLLMQKTLNLRIKTDDDVEGDGNVNARYARLMVSLHFKYSQV